MAFSEGSAYSYLQVDRPVTNHPEAFISKVAFYGARVFGTRATAAIAEVSIDTVQSEGGESMLEVPTHRKVTVRQPVLEVYPADSLRLILLRRGVTISMASKFKLKHHANRFTSSSTSTPINPDSRPSIHDRVDAISLKHDLDPNNTLVEFDHFHDPTDTWFGSELALAPRLSSVGGMALREQVGVCTVGLAELSSTTANPSSPTAAYVPFMQIPEDITPRQWTRFMDEIQGLLPIFLTLGSMDAHAKTEPGKGVA